MWSHECYEKYEHQKIKYYFAHDEEREKIARAGYERSIRDHTCEKRLNEIFKIIGLKK